MSKCPFCARPVPDDATVCPHCVRALPRAGTRTAKPEPEPRSWGRLLLLIAILGGAGAYAFREYRPVEEAPVAPAPLSAPTVQPPLEVAIADSASVTVERGRYLAFPFSGGGRSTCRVEGSVRALAGGDRTINVFIVDRDGLAQLEGGTTPRTYFESGPLPSVSLNLNVDGRTEYVLVVSNAASPTRAKTVRLQSVRASCTD